MKMMNDECRMMNGQRPPMAATLESLHACPFCGQAGYTRIGLRQHFCPRAPALSGEESRNHKGSRKLTHDEWFSAVNGKGARS